MTTLSDQTLKCSDCPNSFTFTVRDQEFYTTQGFTPPKRCKACRQAKKDRSNGGGASASQGPSNVYHAPGYGPGATPPPNEGGGGGQKRSPKAGGKGRRRENQFED